MAADAIVTIGKNLSDYFIRVYKKPVFTVYNGYEESDFDTLPGNKANEESKKYLVHFGSLSASQVWRKEWLV